VGTRLLSEHMIKNCYPYLRYIRIHTVAKNAAVIYAWNEDLRLTEQEMSTLSRFASGYLTPYVCFKIKEYPLIQKDRVPQVYELPDRVAEAAMSRTLDQYQIVAVMNRMLANGEMAFQRYAANTGTIHFEMLTSTRFTEIEKDLIHQYLYELIPLGSNFEVSY
jgi:hypothetical protein